jgi:hypothetical protein
MLSKLSINTINPATKSCGFFFILLFSVSLLGAQAKIEVRDTKKSFGFVKKGEVVKINYVVKNIGNSPLIIEEIEVSCSCTKSEFSPQPILPNTTQTVTLIFNTETTYDRQDRVALLHSNGSNKPIKLRYKGVVLSK